ncbi:MAG: response regulator [Candidatus Scalindua sp.]|nr:response regulator [Candidatus Scalindua sp.]
MLEKKKIILIEDNPGLVDLITEIIKEGYIERDIVLARDGMEAIDRFQELSIKWNGEVEDKIKLIILDLDLSNINGMDILRFIKKNPRYSRIPIITLSTDSDKTTIDEAYSNGVSEFVTKSLSYDDFVANLRGLKEFY